MIVSSLTNIDRPASLVRVPFSGLNDLCLWMLTRDPKDESAGAWAGETDRQTIEEIAEALIVNRLWWVGTAEARQAAFASSDANVRADGEGM